MDYILIIIFQVLGFLYKSGQQLAVLKSQYKGMNGKQISDIYFKEDWNTFLMSGVVLLTDLAVHYVVSMLDIDWTKQFPIGNMLFKLSSVYLIGSIALAAVLGFKGQDLIYKWLGTAADRLDEKITDKIKNG